MGPLRKKVVEAFHRWLVGVFLFFLLVIFVTMVSFFSRCRSALRCSDSLPGPSCRDTIDRRVSCPILLIRRWFCASGRYDTYRDEGSAARLLSLSFRTVAPWIIDRDGPPLWRGVAWYSVDPQEYSLISFCVPRVPCVGRFD